MIPASSTSRISTTVITYRELRALELEILLELHRNALRETQHEFAFDVTSLSLIDVDQMYGIEIEEFPARIAEVALWLADHQANIALSEAFGQLYQRIPLKNSPHILCANALRADWETVLPPEKCSYILGNPPFVGRHYQTTTQMQFVPNATTWHFGILTAAMHMAWMRLVCGRLKSDYRYSNTLVYNNFPWPTDVTEAQRAKVEECARGVLAAREQFPGSTLADLYDPVSMPPALAKAHADLDRAVDRCYRKEPFTTDRQRVEFLFARYEQLAAPLAKEGRKKRK